MNKIEKVLMATGIEQFDALASDINGFEYVGSCKAEERLIDDIDRFHPDIVVISDNICNESASGIIKRIRKERTNIRVIYFCGSWDIDDRDRFDELRELSTDYQVYDLIIAEKVNEAVLKKALKTKQGPGFFNMIEKNRGPAWEDNASELYKGEVNNLSVFTSLKPGSGKTFLSTNTSCALALYAGSDKKIAFIEADFDSPSIGTVLGIDLDNGKNIKVAFDAIEALFDGNTLTADATERASADEIIKSCFIKYNKIPNLHVLQGSTLSPIKAASYESIPEYYMYLINAIKDDYDQIIVDLNSSLIGTPTYAFLKKAKNIFTVVSLDTNSIHTTLKYVPVLKEMDISNKIKWILNQEVKNTKDFSSFGIKHEELLFTGKDFETNYFTFDFKVPALEYSVFLNRLYAGTPVMLDKNKPYTKNTRDAIRKIASSIEELENAPEETKEKEKKSFFFFGRKK